ncbi:MAG: ferredoxin [Novosphingobium sp.]|nr:ferredoxin [Novosphingobium sp.]
MKIVVDWSLCEGNGNCEAVAPELFALNDEDELEVLNDTPSADLREKAESAVRSCPKAALSIQD